MNAPTLIEGVPVPYTIQNDDIITGLLYATVIIVIVAAAQSRDFISRQFRALFRDSENSRFNNLRTETATEVRYQFFLAFQTCLMLGLATYILIGHFFSSAFSISRQHILILLLTGCFLCYFFVKLILQYIVGWVYFEPHENQRWQKSQLFLFAVEGLPLLPIVLLLCYYSMTYKAALILCISVVMLVKILTFYRCYTIFFKKNRPYLQIFLYFCTLEIVPMIAFYGLVASMIDAIKVQ